MRILDHKSAGVKLCIDAVRQNLWEFRPSSASSPREVHIFARFDTSPKCGEPAFNAQQVAETLLENIGLRVPVLALNDPPRRLLAGIFAKICLIGKF